MRAQLVYRLITIVSLSATVSAQAGFAGKWETAINPQTGKPMITLNLVCTTPKVITGTVVLANPNGSQIRLPILNAQQTNDTLRFQTNDQGTRFDWWLTLENDTRKATLHGADRRSASWGQSGESVIEERVFKR